MTEFVKDLNNVELLTKRHKEQLINEGLFKEDEIDSVIQNDFLNSKVSDVDYLLEDLQVDIVDGVVVDLNYKSDILEMMENDPRNFIQSLISIETNITDKETLNSIYDNYLDKDDITLLHPELNVDIEPTLANNKEGLLDKLDRIEGKLTNDIDVANKDNPNLER